ncbi:Ku protein [Streptomyces sp. NPDC096193]|uniref:non-homologous end joining protein Ku n=1 Tax=Streptomyces sp. NPDC096193 TaxID=3155821 RepID=UPI003318C9B8
MRSIWNGAISFGLVSIPVKLMNATENHSISFRQIHAADGGRIRYRKVCELEEKEVPNDEIGKGYETEDGSVIPITDEDLAKLPLPTAKTIEIVAFVPGTEVDPLQIDAAYYLSANGGPAVKPYTVLREALKRSQKVALAKFALRGRERLGMLRVVEDVIAMHGLLWPDEIRSPDEVAPDGDVTVREAELDLADALMNTLGEVDMDSLHDHYREAVEEMIAAKAQGAELPAAPEGEGGGGQVIDLMAALESSVRAAKNAQGGDAGTDTGTHAEVTPIKGRKKTAASKTAAKKTGAAKTAAGKKAAKKTAAKKTASKAATKTAASKKATSGAAKKTAASKTAAKKTTKASPKKRASA